MGHSKLPENSATKAVNRMLRLRRRMENLTKFPKTPNRLAEISALEWALPILEAYIKDKFPYVPKGRMEMYKHQREDIVTALLARDGTICYLCKQYMPPSDMTIDHVLPLSKGGYDTMANYRLTHEQCNLDKGNMTLTQFRELQEKSS